MRRFFKIEKVAVLTLLVTGFLISCEQEPINSLEEQTFRVEEQTIEAEEQTTEEDPSLEETLRAPTPGGTAPIYIMGNSNGKYVSSENGWGPMHCDRENPQGWEKFTMIFQPNDKVAFLGPNNKYVSSEGGYGPMTCNRDQINDWELFTLEYQGTGHGVVAIKGSNGKYVSSENGVGLDAL